MRCDVAAIGEQPVGNAATAFRTTNLFSATMPPPVERLARKVSL
jgi:superfamily II DNA/RNA helicase